MHEYLVWDEVCKRISCVNVMLGRRSAWSVCVRLIFIRPIIRVLVSVQQKIHPLFPYLFLTFRHIMMFVEPVLIFTMPSSVS